MTNQQCRLIASAIIVLAGGLTLSFGLVAMAINRQSQGGEIVGSIILVVGSILFLSEYFSSKYKNEI